MQKFPRKWDKLTCVNYLQRKIILNAIAYYEFDDSRLSDKEYDELSMQLVNLHKEVNIQDTQYGYIMYDFDGSTGFDLYGRLNDKDREYLLAISRSAGIGKQQKKEIKVMKKKGGLF